jgi:hypothetical protein
MYTSRHTNLPWRALWLSPWGERYGSHTTYPGEEACTLAPRISRTDRSNELRLVPRPPRCIRVEAYENLTVRTVAQPMGREIMAPILPPSE